MGISQSLNRQPWLYLIAKCTCILTDGPFFICCNRESIFLSVSDSHQIEATQDIQHASKFYIVRCDEGDDHFFIIHEAPTSLHDENVTKFEKMPPVPMYLKASMNWRRRSTPTKPLMMEMNVNSRLSIHNRRDKEFHPAKLTEWVSQKEVFFIRCEEQARLYRKTSYLCVYQPKGEATYITGCKPNIRSDDNNRFMLFRLVKLKKDEVSMCAATTSIAPFIIKFRASVRFWQGFIFWGIQRLSRSTYHRGEIKGFNISSKSRKVQLF